MRQTTYFLTSKHQHPKLAFGPSLSKPSSQLKQAVGIKTRGVPIDDNSTTVQVVNPMFRQLKVEATDEFSAPVAKLSQWLANDPTKAQKKFLQVRKGRNVVEKSLKFETVLEIVTRKDCGIPKGVVLEKKKLWQASDQPSTATAMVPHFRETKMSARSTLIDFGDLQPCDNHRSFETFDSPTESPTTTTSNTQKWLTDASVSIDHGTKSFEEDIRGPEHTNGSMQHSRHELRDETTPSAIQSVGSNTASSQGESSGLLEQYEGQAGVFRGNDLGNDRKEEANPALNTETDPTLYGLFNVDGGDEMHTGHPSYGEGKDEIILADSSKGSNDSQLTKELVAKWDKEKGTEKKAVTKVQMRKEKLERMEKESRRRSGPYGLLKPTWKRAHPARGLPSDAYMRTFKGKVAPKKTLEELP